MARTLPSLRTLLVLGRVSNLPTVWSNCLAAWWLAGGTDWLRFAIVCAAATALYTGGMFLNDAFDVEFDCRFRKERPIPSGQIAVQTVWWIGGMLLVLGCTVFAFAGSKAALFALVLSGCIVAYDAIHKHTALAPLLMAGCRFLLYVVVAAAACGAVSGDVLWCATALAAYIAGLSYLARGESDSRALLLWPLALLLAPVLMAVARQHHHEVQTWIAAAVFCASTGWHVRGEFQPANARRRIGVAGLLAGIVLVDWLAVASGDAVRVGVFAGLFFLALILQRVVPAT